MRQLTFIITSSILLAIGCGTEAVDFQAWGTAGKGETKGETPTKPSDFRRIALASYVPSNPSECLSRFEAHDPNATFLTAGITHGFVMPAVKNDPMRPFLVVLKRPEEAPSGPHPEKCEARSQKITLNIRFERAGANFTSEPMPFRSLRWYEVGVYPDDQTSFQQSRTFHTKSPFVECTTGTESMCSVQTSDLISHEADGPASDHQIIWSTPEGAPPTTELGLAVSFDKALVEQLRSDAEILARMRCERDREQLPKAEYIKFDSRLCFRSWNEVYSNITMRLVLKEH